MEVEIYWNQPVPLRSGRHSNLIYMADLEAIPTNAGVYIFGRLSRGNLIPMYVGKALRLRGRIRNQFNNARLMIGIANSPGRRRVLLAGELVGKPGQELRSTLDLVERNLIEYATLDGYPLLNQQGTKPRTNTLSFSGARVARTWLPSHLTVTKARRRRQ